ncbi:MAG TPA: ATP-binding cassette domain-containing protein [Acetobacteraceae bacterium]|nr:ATP-binding cassette domain-containing protein [Acetobacteraceae bacterium]
MENSPRSISTGCTSAHPPSRPVSRAFRSPRTDAAGKIRAMNSRGEHTALAPAKPMIMMVAAGKSCRLFKALTNINLAVCAGKKIALCGPSGSGKSTPICCICHKECYQAGRIYVVRPDPRVHGLTATTPGPSRSRWRPMPAFPQPMPPCGSPRKH